MDKQDLIANLLLTQKYLSVAISMLENDRPCEEVLHEIATARVTLDAVELQLLENQLQSSFDLIRFDPCPNRRCTELTRILDLYQILNKQTLFYRQSPHQLRKS